LVNQSKQVRQQSLEILREIEATLNRSQQAFAQTLR